MVSDWAGQPMEPGVNISRPIDAEQREEVREWYQLSDRTEKHAIMKTLEILGMEDILEDE